MYFLFCSVFHSSNKSSTSQGNSSFSNEGPRPLLRRGEAHIESMHPYKPILKKPFHHERPILC